MHSSRVIGHIDLLERLSLGLDPFRLRSLRSSLSMETVSAAMDGSFQSPLRFISRETGTPTRDTRSRAPDDVAESVNHHATTPASGRHEQRRRRSRLGLRLVQGRQTEHHRVRLLSDVEQDVSCSDPLRIYTFLVGLWTRRGRRRWWRRRRLRRSRPVGVPTPW